MHIRELQEHDAESYVVIRREMLRDAPWAFAATEAGDKGLDAAGMRAGLAGGAIAVVGAWDGEALIGVAGLSRPRHDKMAHRADVWGVYVTPRARGRGVCAAILDAVIARALRWPGVDSLRLSVSVRSGAARRAYERAGFAAWGTEPRALAWNGEQIDEVHMVWLKPG